MNSNAASIESIDALRTSELNSNSHSIVPLNTKINNDSEIIIEVDEYEELDD